MNLDHLNLKAVLAVLLPLLVAFVVIRAVLYILRRGLPNARWLVDFGRVFALLAWGLVALHFTGLLPEAIDFLEGITFTAGKQRLNLWVVLQGVAAVLVTLLVALWLGSLVEARLLAAQGLDSSLRVVFARLAKALLIVLAVLIGLPAVGIDLTMLSVFGGALGVGLGFGLQKIAANYISGFIILLDRSIRIGDLIRIGNERGQVTQITTRYTVLRGLTGVEALVPNEVLVSSIVENESYTDSTVRIAVAVQVGYGADLERALAILVAVARATPRVLAAPEPRALVLALADSGINLELGFWIDDPQEGTGQLRSDLNLAIWKAFRAEGIEIPFPQRDVRIVGGDSPR